MSVTKPPSLIRLEPHQQPVVWGGRKLHDLLDKPPSDSPVGESWEVWEGDSIRGQEWAGETLATLCERFPSEILGSAVRQPPRFPLLTKFIDAQQPLSVQVHPNDAQAMALERQPNGKTEAWHIIQADPGAWIIHGLNQEIGAEEFRARLQEGSADPLLRRIPAQAGDTIFVPARTVHAIGPGVVLHEIQQSSTTTYRLYDWNRTENGVPRELHLDKGLEVAHLAPQRDPIVRPLTWTEGGTTIDLILASEYFFVQRLELQGSLALKMDGRSFKILTVTGGACSIHVGQGTETALAKGDSCVVAAGGHDLQLTARPRAELFVERISESWQNDVVKVTGLEMHVLQDFASQFAPLV